MCLRGRGEEFMREGESKALLLAVCALVIMSLSLGACACKKPSRQMNMIMMSNSNTDNFMIGKKKQLKTDNSQKGHAALCN